MTEKPTIMAVDGNSLLHRSFHALAGTNLHDNYGRPTWAIKGMLNQLCAAVDRIRPDALVIGFDTPGDSVRRERYAEYKATRSEKKPELVTQLELAQSMFRWAGFAVRTPAGLEADDVTAAAAHLAGQHGWEAVIVTSDRDSFAHISEHTKVLRIINGGIDNSPLLDPDKLYALTGIRAGQYLDYAALRGDTSDNLPGPKGIGEKTAAKLLAGFDSMADVWADLAGDGDKVADVAGNACRTRLRAEGAHHAWSRNVDIMTAVVDIDLGIDLASRTGEGMLPLDSAKLAEACAVLNMAASTSMVVGSLGATRTPDAPAPADAPEPEPAVDAAWYPDAATLAAAEPPPEEGWETVTVSGARHPAAEVQLF